MVSESGGKPICIVFNKGLNPYCSGIWSRSKGFGGTAPSYLRSLNPYCSGIWSRRWCASAAGIQMGECLNPYCSGIWSRREDFIEYAESMNSLNPYCSGIWSRRKSDQVPHLW